MRAELFDYNNAGLIRSNPQRSARGADLEMLCSEPLASHFHSLQPSLGETVHCPLSQKKEHRAILSGR